MNNRIKISITTNQLTKTVKTQMWEVYHKYYHYTKAEFMQRIERNNYYSFYKVDNQIVGFTGLRIDRTTVQNKKQLLIYFGQTVIGEKYRGQSLIPVTGFKLCMKFWKEFISSDVYCWADSLTYKAYLVFAKTVAEMYPSRKHSTSSEVKELINHIGSRYYSGSFCEKTGTVKKDKVLVNGDTLHIPMKYKADEDIRFFVKANPMFEQGHGLITITPMNRRNIGNLLNRYIKKTFSFKVLSYGIKQIISRKSKQTA